MPKAEVHLGNVGRGYRDIWMRWSTPPTVRPGPPCLPGSATVPAAPPPP